MTNETNSSPSQLNYSDPDSMRLNLRLATVILCLIAFLLLSIGMNVYQYARKPELVVAVTTPSGDRVVKINNREYGMTDAIQLGPDRLSNEDKRYLASEFAKALYGIDPASRPRDIERALRMMVPAEAVKYANFLKQSGELETQSREKWQAVWTEQENKIDALDPYTVHIIGEQQVTKVKGDQVVKVTIQHSLDFKVVADLPRSDRNLRSGFLVGIFGGKELSRSAEAAAN